MRKHTMLIGIYLFMLYTVSVFIGLPPCFCEQEKEGMAKLYEEALMCFEKGSFEKAEEMFEEVVKDDPDNADAYNNLGLITSLDDGRIKESIVYFLKAVKRNPYFAEPFSNLGIICHKIGQFDRAESYLKRAIVLEPDNPEYRVTLGWIYISGIKNYENAVDELKKALEYDKNCVEAYYLLGMAYADLGKKIEVFAQVTSLRTLNREDLASVLEDTIRTPYNAEIEKEEATDVEMAYGISESRSEMSGSGSISGPARIGGSGVLQMRIKFQDKTPVDKAAE